MRVPAYAKSQEDETISQPIRSRYTWRMRSVALRVLRKALAGATVVRVAALRLDEALAYLHWHAPDFVIESVQKLGLILMVSGSPVD